MKTISDEVKELLFGDGAGVFAVLDGASVQGLLGRLHQFRPESVCLYRGELKPDMAEVAPYLVKLERDSEFTQWVLKEGWGQHWGIFAVTQGDLFALRQHFRRFLIVHDESGKAMYFRFYDPRVMRAYLPTCNEQELVELFGPVEGYVVEDEKPEVLLRFRLASGALATSKESLGTEKARA